MTLSSQEFESYVPVYDAIPETWDEAKPFIVEQLKRISNAVNVREIGFFLDQELLSGKQFIPSPQLSGTSQQFRTVLRKIIDASPLAIGANTVAHNIVFDSNFTLIDMWVAATNSLTLNAQVITNANVTMDATNVNINSPAVFDKAYCVIEYCQEA